MVAASNADDARRHENSANGVGVGVLIYIVLTVAIFALLGLTVKLVERL